MRAFYNEQTAYIKLADFLKDYIDDNTIIVCIGTNRIIGDCLGPLVGTMLKEKHFSLRVYGTLSEPIHAYNIKQKLEEIKRDNYDSKVIAVDACIDENVENVGIIKIKDHAIHPGAGTGKSLPTVGDTSINGIVYSNRDSQFSQFLICKVKLDIVFEMAKMITKIIICSYYLYKNNKSKFI